MLQCLHIRNLALIETAEIRFDNGLNVISGETGGGKSLVVTALKLLRGEKAPATLMRHGAEELRVDGEFLLGQSEPSRAVAALVHELCGLEPEDDQLVVTRILDPKGRSKVRINGRPSTLAVLRELCGWLLEIHGQGETRALMRPEIQSEMLDAFGGTEKLRLEFSDALGLARGVQKRLEEAAGSERDRLARLEFLRFQVGEIDEVGITEGENNKLEEEHRVLANLDDMRERLDTSLAALQDDEPSAAGLLAKASRALADAAAIDTSLVDAAEQVAEAQVQIEEAARIVQLRRGSLDLDSGRLSQVEERLAEVRRALSRFGPTEAVFFENAEKLRSELDTLEAGDASPETMERDLREKLTVLAKIGKKLVRARRKAGNAFVKTIEGELKGLGMSDTRFEIGMDDEVTEDGLLDRASSHGPGPIEFMVRINPGEPLKSLRETASGGETARIVLAVKKCLAEHDRVPFLVFDEVDSEIGGRLGLQVGKKLKAVSSNHQVLIVTHLPQVAAFSDAHFKVKKDVRDGRTRSEVSRLVQADVERELAAMSAGEGADAEAVTEARRLIEKARGAEAEA